MGGAASVKIKNAASSQDKQVEALLHDKAKLKSLWKDLDFNGNGMASLAEIDKFIISVPGFKRFNNKPAMLRAYKKTTKGGNADAYVQRKEFPTLLQNIYYFDKLWKAFASIDTGGDRRVDLKEFGLGMKKLNIKLTEAETQAAFSRMDRNGGGQVLFDEFCKFAARMASGQPVNIDDGNNQQQRRVQPKKKPMARKPVKQVSEIERLTQTFDSVAGSKRYVESDELGLVLQRSKMTTTRAEFLQLSDALGLNDDGRVTRAEFIAFFQKKLAPKNNAKYNRMLVKPTIGKAKGSSYNLPNEYHTYGNKVNRDAEGSKDVIFTWSEFEPTSVNVQKLNIIKMNKNAIGHGAVSPKAMARFNKSHKIYDEKTLSGSKSRKQMLEDNRKLTDPAIRGATFGITARAGTPIGSLITGSYGAQGEEAMYPKHTAADNKRAKKLNAKRFDSSRPTKASMGHAAARAKLEASKTTAPVYKMKRFENVKSRLGGQGKQLHSAGLDVVGNRR